LRSSNGKEYLEKCFSQYNQLTEHSKLLKSKYKKYHLIVDDIDLPDKSDTSGASTPTSLSDMHLPDNELLV